MAEFIEALKEVGKKNEFKESFPKEIETKEKKDSLVGIDGWLLIYTLYIIPGTISFIIILPFLFNLFNSENIYCQEPLVTARFLEAARYRPVA